MAKGLFRKTLNGYAPEDSRARDLWAKHKPGQTVEIDVKVPRNIKAHRLYWAMCDKIGDAIGADPGNVSNVLKFRTGNVIRIKTATATYEVPGSIAFNAMDDVAFSTFLTQCVQIIKEEWLPKMKESDIREELIGMVAA